MNHISFSQIQTYLKCGCQYEFRYIDKKIIPPPAVLILGKDCHKGLEHNFKQKIESRKDLAQEEVVQKFVDSFEEDKNLVDWVKEETKEGEVKDSGIKMLSKFHTEASPLIQPELVEEKFTVSFEGGYPDLIGYWDRVDEGGIIADTKFVSKKPSQSIEEDIQMTAYDLGYRIRFGNPPHKLMKQFIINTKETKLHNQECLAREQEVIDRFLLRMAKTVEAIEKGIFLPAQQGSWQCSQKWCGYWDICKVKP